MIVKGIIDEDFINYKKPSMVILFPNCTFKCEKECGLQVCHNSTLVNQKNIRIVDFEIADRYISNNITKAIVLGGLEPMDNFEDMIQFIDKIRKRNCDDDIVIYTGYTEEECEKKRYIKLLSNYNNIIIKFGRFIPNQTPHYDEVLGIKLASDNQYGKKIS